MSRFVRFALTGAALTAPIGAYALVVRPWMRRWGVDQTEAATLFPGDELIPEASGQDTRGITIDAAPEDVWPWLAQMGFGRAGWYSYDRLDMKGTSAAEIHPEWQTLAVGDVMPTHPAGGFAVRVLEPGQALSLYLDTELVKAQAEAAGVRPPATMQGGMALSGAVMGTQPEEFKASWTFIVRPTPDGSTRLIERFRFQYPPQVLMARFATEAFGFGVFLMMRKQMLGIRERAERLARSKLPAPYVPQPGGPTFEAPAPA